VKLVVWVEVHRTIETARIVNEVFEELHGFNESPVVGAMMLNRQYEFRSRAWVLRSCGEPRKSRKVGLMQGLSARYVLHLPTNTLNSRIPFIRSSVIDEKISGIKAIGSNNNISDSTKKILRSRVRLHHGEMAF
jgi:hypothetical protein